MATEEVNGKRLDLQGQVLDKQSERIGLVNERIDLVRAQIQRIWLWVKIEAVAIVLLLVYLAFKN